MLYLSSFLRANSSILSNSGLSKEETIQKYEKNISQLDVSVSFKNIQLTINAREPSVLEDFILSHFYVGLVAKNIFLSELGMDGSEYVCCVCM